MRNRHGWFDSSNETRGLRPDPSSAHGSRTAPSRGGRSTQTPRAAAALQGVPYQDNEATRHGAERGRPRLVARRQRRDPRRAPLAARHRRRTGARSARNCRSRNAHSAPAAAHRHAGRPLIAAALVLVVTLLLRRRGRQARQPARGASADRGHPAHGEGRPVPARPGYGHRRDLFERVERLFHRKDFAGLEFEDLLRGIVSERTLATAAQIRRDPVVRAHQGEFGQVHQSLGRSGSAHHHRPGQRRHALSGVRFSPGARRRRDHPRAGLGVGRHRARRSGARAHRLAKPGAGAGRYAARHFARRSGAIGLLSERYRSAR